MKTEHINFKKGDFVITKDNKIGTISSSFLFNEDELFIIDIPLNNENLIQTTSRYSDLKNFNLSIKYYDKKLAIQKINEISIFINQVVIIYSNTYLLLGLGEDPDDMYYITYDINKKSIVWVSIYDDLIPLKKYLHKKDYEKIETIFHNSFDSEKQKIINISNEVDNVLIYNSL